MNKKAAVNTDCNNLEEMPWYNPKTPSCRTIFTNASDVDEYVVLGSLLAVALVCTCIRALTVLYGGWKMTVLVIATLPCKRFLWRFRCFFSR